MKIMFTINVVQKLETRVLYPVTFFSENHAVYVLMWIKYCTAAQATDDNMAHAHFILDA